MYDLELRRLQTKEDINQPYHKVWERIPKRTTRTTVAVRIGDCLRWTCSCLAGIVVRGKKFFTPVAAAACGKAVSFVGSPLAYVLALGGMVQYEQASRRYE